MATCNDCAHVEACKAIVTIINEATGLQINDDTETTIDADLDCEYFADRSRFVELPCKIGDKVFSLVGKGEIEKWTVTDIYFSDFGVADINILQIKVRSKDKDKGASFPSHYLGRSFFYTYEEAERALKERKSE